MTKEILDACCGAKMFYFNKDNPNVLFMDKRLIDTFLCDGRRFEIKPDIIGDFKNMPFQMKVLALLFSIHRTYTKWVITVG